MSHKQFLAIWEQYLIYLRKSRQDDPNETIEEVLAKHEIQLQEFALREFGHKIPEENIYREVVSGESIEAREEIKKVLARIEDSNIKGVIVIEPSRLSRGDLLDCGRLINDLRYTKTLVVTPYMTYDLENKMERKFFQDELLRGNDYLEYTKEILWRGRIAAVKRGCYIVGNVSPFGYRKIKVGKDCTLEVVPEEAEVVRMIFDLYTKEGMSYNAVARKLNDIGLKTLKGLKWTKPAVRDILHNEHYRGKVVFNKRRQTTVIENGERVVKRLVQNPEDIIIAEGKHEAIIDQATWEMAQTKITNNPRHKIDLTLKNPYATVLVCSKCGKPLSLNTNPDERYLCRTNKPVCYRSAVKSEIDAAIISALEEAELPALKLKVTNNDGNARKIQETNLIKLQKQLEEFSDQEEKQFELLETGVYSKEVFDRRHTVLVAKMKACREEIDKVKSSMPKEINYLEKVTTLEKVIEVLKSSEATPEEKNKLLKTIVSRIEYTGADKRGNRYTKNEFSIKVFLIL